MTKEANRNSFSSITLSRRKFLQLAAAATCASTVLLAEEKLPFLENQPLYDRDVGLTPKIFIPESLATLPQASKKVEAQKPLSPEMVALRNQLAAEINKYQGQTAISVTDVLSGEIIDVNGNRPQLPGCVANLPCALTAIAQLSSPSAPFSREQIEPVMTIMVRNSDPTAGRRVVSAIGNGSLATGVAKINYLMKTWGMVESFYDHPPAYDFEYSVKSGPNLLVPNEMNRVLTKIAKSEFFEDHKFNWNLYALWVMSNNKVGLNFMIPGEIPEEEAVVVHKVGWWYPQPHFISDAGIVAARDQRFVYAITAMHQNFEFGMGENQLFYGPGFFIRKLSKITYETFVNRYGRPLTYTNPPKESFKRVANNIKNLPQV